MEIQSTPLSSPTPRTTAAPAVTVESPSAEPATPGTVQASTDSLQVSATTPEKARTFEARATFGTGKATIGKESQPELKRTLEAVVASFKTLSPEKQQALLADPHFTIEIEGHASNLGSATNFDNLGLSLRRATQTAQYVKGYLREHGIDVPDSAVKTKGNGSPGEKKALDDNDAADRSASVTFTLPGLDPLPPAPPVPAKPSTPSPKPPAEPPVTTKPTEKPPAEPPATTKPTEKPPTPPTPTGPSATEIALKDFNETALPVGELLLKAREAETTLSERESLVTQSREKLQQAEAIVPKLDPATQLGAKALIQSYRDQVGTLADRVTRERGAFTKAQEEIAADVQQLTTAAEAKDKRPLRKLVEKLQTKYQDLETLGKDLPSDARKTLKEQASGLLKTMRDTIAKHSDNSSFNAVDNSYMFGRPGPKFKEHWNALLALLKGESTATDQRQKAIRHLNEMAEAVSKFDDPVSKQATQAVYDEVSRAVFTKFSAS